MKHEDIMAHIEQKHSEVVSTQGRNEFSQALYEILMMLREAEAKVEAAVHPPEASAPTPMRQRPVKSQNNE